MKNRDIGQVIPQNIRTLWAMGGKFNGRHDKSECSQYYIKCRCDFLSKHIKIFACEVARQIYKVHHKYEDIGGIFDLDHLWRFSPWPWYWNIKNIYLHKVSNPILHPDVRLYKERILDMTWINSGNDFLSFFQSIA